MKKLFTFFALALVAVGAFAGEEFTVNGVRYFDRDNTGTDVYVVHDDAYASMTSVSIPVSVKSPSSKTYHVWGIDSECFKNCTALTSVIIEDGVNYIYANAFNGCSNLKFVRIPNSETPDGIANTAFSNTAIDSIYLNATSSQNLGNIENALKTQVRHITFGTSYTSTPVGKTKSFSNYVALKSVKFVNGIKKIENTTFVNCPIEKIEFPSSLKELNEQCFYNCAMTSLTIPAAEIDVFWNNAFGNCSQLKTIYWNNDYYADGSTTYTGPFEYSGNDVDSIIVIVGANVTSLHKVFHDIDLIKKIDFSQCSLLTSLTNQALYNNNGIKELVLPEGLTTIDDQSVAFCGKLKRVVLPSTLTTIGAQAFDDDNQLTSITCLAATPPTVSANAFENVTKQNATLYVPGGSYSLYKAANVWKDFLNVEAIKVKVKFDLNGQAGTAPETQNVDLGGYATEPTPAPTATGYKFVGWYTTKEGTGSAFDFASTTVNADMTLYAKWLSVAFTLTEGDNTANLATFDGVESIVTVNRGFVADGGWYTLCLPFNMDAALISTTFGTCRIAKLTEVRDKGEGNYYFNFDDVTEIEAGVPYMFMPSANIAANWVVNNVMVSKKLNPIEFTNASMAGVYNTETLPSGAYYLGSNDYLYAYKSGVTTKSLRAYFQFNTISPVSARAVFSGRTITTDLDDALEKAAPKKMLQNGQILIQNDGKVFNIFGLQVK